MHTHLIIFSKKCPANLLDEVAPLKQLLLDLQPMEGIIQGPLLIRRLSGITGFLVSERTHLFVCTSKNGVTLEVGSDVPIEQNKYINALKKCTQVPVQDISFIEFNKDAYVLLECQEPRCAERATRTYHEMHLCGDHYEQWQERRANLRDQKENM